MKNRNKKVDDYVRDVPRWKKEISLLRKICLESDLLEQFKWRNPCYTVQEKNIVLIGATDEYCLISFFKGVLLKDKNELLTAQTINMQSDRQIRFTKLDEIKKYESTIKEYIIEAIEIERSGLKVQMKRTSDYDVPEELQNKFDNDLNFKEAFKALTPGRQKGYLLYFSSAKLSTTRKARIEKYTDRIFDGKGIRDCICGHSKRMPTCDGSHKLYDKT